MDGFHLSTSTPPVVSNTGTAFPIDPAADPCVPSTPLTVLAPGLPNPNGVAAVQPAKRKGAEAAGAERRRAAGSAVPTAAASASGEPKTRKVRSDKGKPRAKAAAARAALENETPEETRRGA
ncbi:hypothetical protein B0H14DRAFT_3502743 [Mycena olivaceomarginata]|nr:hypothetical protein B0H14DRAFT_3502743 [Mycena olivaceomarginata]